MVEAGLCGRCANARRVENRRGSVFILCELHREDPRFRKYPVLPVMECPGYSPRAGGGSGTAGKRDEGMRG